jgi:hypothetical protein
LNEKPDGEEREREKNDSNDFGLCLGDFSEEKGSEAWKLFAIYHRRMKRIDAQKNLRID